MILFVVLGAFGVIILMAIATMFLGRGHLDPDESVNHYLDEVEVISRNIHF
jgi:hypothetical protein